MIKNKLISLLGRKIADKIYSYNETTENTINAYTTGGFAHGNDLNPIEYQKTQRIEDFYAFDPNQVDQALIRITNGSEELEDSAASSFDQMGSGINNVQGYLDTINLNDPSKIEALTNRFKNSETIVKSIKNSFKEMDNIKDFFINNEPPEYYFGSEVDSNEFFSHLYNEGNIPLLNDLYDTVRNNVLNPQESFDSEKLYEIIKSAKSLNSPVPAMNNDFFELFPEATLILTFLYNSGFIYAMYRTTYSRLIYSTYFTAKMSEYRNVGQFSADQISDESPFKPLTAFLHHFCSNRYLRNNIGVDTLHLENTDTKFDIGYVTTHMFVNVFTHEYLRGQYTHGLLKMTGRIGHNHPKYKNPDGSGPIEVTHENEETHQYLINFLFNGNRISDLDIIGLANSQHLKDSNFLGKLLFRGLFDPTIISSISLLSCAPPLV